jgi:hypothetical protein
MKKHRNIPEEANNQNTELQMTNTQWQIPNFRRRDTPHGCSGLKIGHRKLVIGN